MSAINDVVEYCQYEVKKAKLEYSKGEITLVQLQRVCKSINNIMFFAQMKKNQHKEV